jgi:hypothetical protein
MNNVQKRHQKRCLSLADAAVLWFTPHTLGTKEVVLRGGGGKSNRKVNQINSENHQFFFV